MNEELEWLKHANETIEKLKADLAQAKAENQTLRNAQKACEDCDAPTIGEFKRLKAENARLAAASVKARASLSHGLDMIRVGNTDASYTHVLRAHVLLEKTETTNLRDLLAPTIGLLEWIEDGLNKNSLDAIPVRTELSRLRSITEGKP